MNGKALQENIKICLEGNKVMDESELIEFVNLLKVCLLKYHVTQEVTPYFANLIMSVSYTHLTLPTNREV